MNYDLQILVPIIPKRLEGFKKYGLYNVGQKKVLLHCLIGLNNEEIYKTGWPENVEVKIIKGKTNNPIVQIYDFLFNFSLEQALSADWFAKIDDDTFNDISNMVDHLNKYYDSENDFYIVTQLRKDMHGIEIETLKKSLLLEKIDGSFYHELEGCWFSKKSINKIVQNKDCKTLFCFRLSNEKGFTDQCMGAAAKLCKIYPTEEKRFSVDKGMFTNCSIFGGKLYHFHPICKDKNAINYNIINNYSPP